ncbi:bifunctional transaldolase/phosoglucose isomerase [Nitrospira sp. Nam74]
MKPAVAPITSPLMQLQTYGQSPWYDYIRRGLITSGELQRLIEVDGLCGVTSNPSIFEKAIAGSSDYDSYLKQLTNHMGHAKEIYEALAIRDVQDAADLLSPMYKTSQGRDGYVSFEVDPHLADNTQGTIEEAMRLHLAINRENVMIKVPATPQGILAMEFLVSQGICVNVTLLFSVEVYERVAWAYIRGLEAFRANGGKLATVASVASFFLSRIDTVVDQRLETIIQTSTDPLLQDCARALMGKVALANAKIAYIKFQQLCAHPRFLRLQGEGAQVQRLLWASTGTKNPRYPDTYYVDELIGPDTVTAMPAATFTAYRHHGKPHASLMTGLTEANEALAQLPRFGIHLSNVTEYLLSDGTRLFRDAFDALMEVINEKRVALLGPKLDTPRVALNGYREEIHATLDRLRQDGFLTRFWARDSTLWSQDPQHQVLIRDALAWLHIIERQVHSIAQLTDWVKTIQADHFRHCVLLGMGANSICPDVFRQMFGPVPGYPELLILNSTIPAQIRSIEDAIDLDHTLFIVSSKSGVTLELLVLFQYFYAQVRQRNPERAGQQFIAITDPDSQLESLARTHLFRHIFPGVPEIGGRYAALSNFGLVPGALMGLNVTDLLSRAERMRHSCDSCVPPEDNPGITLGVTLATLAKYGRDKVTLITSPSLQTFGAWLEHLLAECTGKDGKGLIPIAHELLGTPDTYYPDRIFVSLNHPPDGGHLDLTPFIKAGHPCIEIDVPHLINIGEEFFRWEVATAVAGALLQVDPFDEPNVQESNDNTKALLEIYQRMKALPAEGHCLVQHGLQVYLDPVNAQHLMQSNIRDVLMAHLGRIGPGDYVALNVYLPRTHIIHHLLQTIRLTIRKKYRVATTLGYGPRFLHSTGQLHKGDPGTGVFFHVTADDEVDLEIPGKAYTFGMLTTAQAMEDFRSLATRHRRLVHIHLGKDTITGLQRLAELIAS